jgi:hypothetical protein
MQQIKYSSRYVRKEPTLRAIRVVAMAFSSFLLMASPKTTYTQSAMLTIPAPQIDPRCIGSVVQAASGPTGQLYYFREYYEGTFCSNEDGQIACIVQGDYHAGDVYFPDPHMKWI